MKTITENHSLENNHKKKAKTCLNPKSTGPFSPGTALGGGVSSTPSIKLDPDILES